MLTMVMTLVLVELVVMTVRIWARVTTLLLFAAASFTTYIIHTKTPTFTAASWYNPCPF